MNNNLFPSSLIALSLLVSCSLSPESSIVGNWKEIGEENSYMEFFKDGTVSATGKYTGTIGGSYEFLDRETVKIEMGGIGAWVGPLIFNVSTKGNELTLSQPNGKVYVYERNK